MNKEALLELFLVLILQIITVHKQK